MVGTSSYIIQEIDIHIQFSFNQLSFLELLQTGTDSKKIWRITNYSRFYRLGVIPITANSQSTEETQINWPPVLILS